MPHPSLRATIKAHHPTPNHPIDSNKIWKGVAKRTQKKEKPFNRAFYTRKEFLLMTHESVSKSKRHLPVPREQQWVTDVTHKSLRVGSSAQGCGRAATLTRLHLYLTVFPGTSLSFWLLSVVRLLLYSERRCYRENHSFYFTGSLRKEDLSNSVRLECFSGVVIANGN
jgi:hypothetical protein